MSNRIAHAAVSAVGLLILLSTSGSQVLASSQNSAERYSSAGQIVAQATPAPAAPAASAPAPGTAGQPVEGRGPAARVESRISQLRNELHITPAQEPQFTAFADVMRANAQTMQALFQHRAQNRDVTAVGMLRWYGELAAAHAEAVNKLIPVFETLYQSLSDEQKKAADAAFQQLRQSRARRRAG